MIEKNGYNSDRHDVEILSSPCETSVIYPLKNEDLKLENRYDIESTTRTSQ